MSKRGYHHGDLSSALVASALELVEEAGLHGLTLRAVARHAGVSHAAPYHHFADRDGLLAAVAEQGFVDLAERMEGAWAGHRRRPFADRLVAAGTAYVAFASQRPACFRVMFAPELGAKDGAAAPRYPALQAAADRAFGVLHAGIVQGQDAGAFAREADARALALAVWSACHGVACLGNDGRLASARAAGAAELAPEVLGWMAAGFAAKGS